MNALIASIYKKIISSPSKKKRLLLTHACQEQMTNELSAIIWAIDPYNTCCNVNPGMADEYNDIASRVLTHVVNGHSPELAWVRAVTYSFWDDVDTTKGTSVIIPAIRFLVNQATGKSTK